MITNEIDELVSGAFIAKLWRQIVFNDGYHKILMALRNEYMQKIVLKATLSNTKLSINKSNIDNKIKARRMTWGNFIFLIKDILRVKNIEIELITTKGDKEQSYKYEGLNSKALVYLWEDISKDYPTLKTKMLDDYLEKTQDDANRVNKTNMLKKITGNADKIEDKVMTWTTLMFLLESLIEIDKLVLKLKITHNDGLHTNHKLTYKIT